MKKILFLFLFLYLTTSNVQAEDIYQIPNDTHKYLFLGEVDDDLNHKLLNLDSKSIVWQKIDNLEQVDRLPPKEFLKKINQNQLQFTLDMMPFNQNLILKENFLEVKHPNGQLDRYILEIALDDSIDSVFLLMFQSTDKFTYGLIRKLWAGTFCEITLGDTQSSFEAYINLNGKLYKGCARLVN